MLPRLKIFFAWYDLWIGAYVDVKGKSLYVCLLPCVVFKLSWSSDSSRSFK